MANSPWLADAADGATMKDYEIRTLADFLKVPESRRFICLREFHAWLHMLKAVPDLFAALGTHATLHDDRWTWRDDGKATISIVMEEPPSDPARLTLLDEGKADGSATKSSSSDISGSQGGASR